MNLSEGKDLGKFYVGQTKHSPKKRAGKNGIKYNKCSYFWNASQKYGWDAFGLITIKTGLSKRIKRTTEKRNRRISDYIHKASRIIINHAVSNNINTIVIGYNKGWKQEVNIGKVNNQKFVAIPFKQLIEMIRYKAQLKGINVIITEESYTSKCSFID